MPVLICLREKTLNEDLLYRGSSANLPRLHTCENKVPFWDFSQFAVTIGHKEMIIRMTLTHFTIISMAKNCLTHLKSPKLLDYIYRYMGGAFTDPSAPTGSDVVSVFKQALTGFH